MFWQFFTFFLTLVLPYVAIGINVILAYRNEEVPFVMVQGHWCLTARHGDRIGVFLVRILPQYLCAFPGLVFATITIWPQLKKTFKCCGSRKNAVEPSADLEKAAPAAPVDPKHPGRKRMLTFGFIMGIWSYFFTLGAIATYIYHMKYGVNSYVTYLGHNLSDVNLIFFTEHAQTLISIFMQYFFFLMLATDPFARLQYKKLWNHMCCCGPRFRDPDNDIEVLMDNAQAMGRSDTPLPGARRASGDSDAVTITVADLVGTRTRIEQMQNQRRKILENIRKLTSPRSSEFHEVNLNSPRKIPS
jgi:hypothetical protein